MNISISADGDYRFDESSSHTLRCDGKDRPLENNQTLVCVKSGVTALDIVLKKNGIKMRATHDELSTDGKLFTTTVTEFRPNGPVFTSQITFSRVSGSNGFAGQWQDTSYLQQHADMTLRLDSQTLHIGYPSVGQQIDAPLDGADAAVRGPRVLAGSTFAVHSAGRRQFRTVAKRQGKLFSQGTLELSNDGRTIIALCSVVRLLEALAVTKSTTSAASIAGSPAGVKVNRTCAANQPDCHAKLWIGKSPARN